MTPKFKQGKKQSLKGYLNSVYLRGYKTPSSMRKVAGVRNEKITAYFLKYRPMQVKGFKADVTKQFKTGLYSTKKQARAAVFSSPKYVSKRKKAVTIGWGDAQAKFDKKAARKAEHDTSKKRYSWNVNFDKVYKDGGRTENETARYSSNRRLSNAEVERRVKRMFASSPYTVENVKVLDMTVDRGFNKQLDEFL
jgi:hypothetical protein